MTKELESVLSTAVKKIENASSTRDINELTLEYSGRKGIINSLFESLPKLPPDQRAAFGKEFNELKQTIEALISKQREKVKLNKITTTS